MGKDGTGVADQQSDSSTGAGAGARGEWVLRPMAPTDGPGLAELFAQTPDAGQIGFTARFKLDPYAGLAALHDELAGVVAVLPATRRIVGLGLVDLGTRQIEGAPRPTALLHTLKVHPDYRQRGIAGELAAWRVAHARRHLGEDAVILAQIQQNNTGSERTARRWARQTVGQLTTALVRPSERQPRPRPGLTLRPALPGELAAFAAAQQDFYRDYNIYHPQTADTLATWRARTPLATPIREIVVATDAAGTVLAGAEVTERGRVRSLEVGRLPTAITLVNRAIRLLPADGVVDEVVVSGLWFRPGQLATARALWAWLRWAWRERGSLLRIDYDPRGPLPGVLQLPPWLPTARSTFVAQSPVPLDPARLYCPPE
jgi:ribosomal protein S18 acetylase RimI-like enzyme